MTTNTTGTASLTPENSASTSAEPGNTILGQPGDGGAPPPNPSPEVKPNAPAEKPPVAPVVPDKYDLKLPEGSPLDPARIVDLEAYAKANKLTNEQAQGILEREHAAVAAHAKAQQEQYAKTLTEWRSQVEADKEIGGAEFKRNVELASRVITKFGSESLKAKLDESGLGNHPELVRTFVRIGKAMANDQLVLPGARPAERKSAAEVLYGGTHNIKKE